MVARSHCAISLPADLAQPDLVRHPVTATPSGPTDGLGVTLVELL